MLKTTKEEMALKMEAFIFITNKLVKSGDPMD